MDKPEVIIRAQPPAAKYVLGLLLIFFVFLILVLAISKHDIVETTTEVVISTVDRFYRF
jgi:hypothetical protein